MIHFFEWIDKDFWGFAVVCGLVIIFALVAFGWIWLLGISTKNDFQERQERSEEDGEKTIEDLGD